MTNPNLATYIAQLRNNNIQDDLIKSQLEKNGWDPNEVDAALAPQSLDEGGILPPPPVPRFSMWVSFQYVILFITLWIWSTSLGGIWHYAIDKHISDPLSKLDGSMYSSAYSSYILQGYLAAIIVAYPFFVWLFVVLKKQLLQTPGVRSIKTRKFLIYLTMIGNFLYMITQLMATVFGYLNATSSTRTLPHLFVNLFITGAICLYLLKEVKEDRKANNL